jgi:hypothetical protein
MKLNKVAFHISLPYFSVSTMHEAVSEAVLPNGFPKIARLHPENCP